MTLTHVRTTRMLWLTTILLAGNLFAQELDMDFGVDGQVPYGGPLANSQQNKGMGYNSVLQPDGKIVVSMDKYDPNSTDWYFYTYRYNPDGSPDNLFGDNGVSRLFVGDQCRNYDLQLEANGNIVVIGESEYCINGICGAAQFIMMRLLPNGALDTSFGEEGHLLTTHEFGTQGTFAIPYRVRQLPGGKYLIGGRGIGGKPFVARLNNNGDPDISYATNGVHQDTTTYQKFVDLMVDADQNSYALIMVYNYANGVPDTTNVTDVCIVKLDPDGELDPSFGDNGRLVANLFNADHPSSIAIAPDGKLIVTGTHWIALVEPDGTLSTSIPNGVQEIIIPGEGAMFVDKVVVVAIDRYMLSGKVHQYSGGNYQEKAFMAQVDAQGQFRPDFNGTGYMLFDHGQQATSGWNGKLCRLFDVDVTTDGVAYGTGVRNPIAGNTQRGLFLVKVTGVPVAGPDVSVSEVQSDLGWSVFPNPTSGSVQVRLSQGAEYVLLNATGGVVASGRLFEGDNTLALGAAYAPGPYLLRLVDGNGEAVGSLRVVKE